MSNVATVRNVDSGEIQIIASGDGGITLVQGRDHILIDPAAVADFLEAYEMLSDKQKREQKIEDRSTWKPFLLQFRASEHGPFTPALVYATDINHAATRLNETLRKNGILTALTDLPLVSFVGNKIGIQDNTVL